MDSVKHNCYDPALTPTQTPNVMGFSRLTYAELFAALLAMHDTDWLASCVVANESMGALFIAFASGQTRNFKIGPFLG